MGNKLFGTDGVRGIANEFPMTAEFAFRLAKTLGQLICSKKKTGSHCQRHASFGRYAGSGHGGRFYFHGG